MHPSWKAYIKLGLVSIPIQAYSASRPGREHIALHQLHQGHARIQYHKFCPVHGEVPNDEIVKGYEFAKGEYVVMDPAEIEQIESGGDRSVNLQVFVRPQVIDPLYFSGKSYYLLPDGSAGQKPYELLAEALRKKTLYGIGTMVLGGRQHLVVLRPVEHILTISGLEFKSELRDVSTFSEDHEAAEFSSKELKLTEALVEATTEDKLDFGQFHDVYEEKLRDLIDAKVAGKEVAVVSSEQPRPAINMMEALQKSLAQRKRSRDGSRRQARGRGPASAPRSRGHLARKKA